MINDYVAQPIKYTLDSGDVEKCTGCNLCVQECSFLQKVGNPLELIETSDEKCNSFECSLCGLCATVCPEGIDPSRYFLQLRLKERNRQGFDDKRHSSLIAYERKGTSKLFTFYGLPEGCDTVFFPGCAMPGTRPDTVLNVYEHLKSMFPALGIVLDCCLKPSHDLGREEHFVTAFGEMRDYLELNGIIKVLVACPNCQRIFSQYGGKITVQTVYELLGKTTPSSGASVVEAVMHDPCVSRFDPLTQHAARKLAASRGVKIIEMEHSKERTICCGRGGGVNFISRQMMDDAISNRTTESGNKPIVTYCAACAETFSKNTQSVHLLDLWKSPADAIAGKIKVSRVPFTYLNRIMLKRKFRRSGEFAVTRERNLGEKKGRPYLRSIIIAVLVVVAIFGVRASGLSALLEPESLRQFVENQGSLGPIFFILLYTVTPVLFLPGLPMTIAAGILFGPFWGVVYAIVGATLGACASFLIARYAARDWVESKMTGSMIQNLNHQAGEQGWKIVAITRLIPLFPYNLLNYAYGLTKVPFIHYAVTSFFCMLPACIAFIVFSSSLPQLLKGNVSPAFIIGIVSIAVVSIVPLWFRRKEITETRVSSLHSVTKISSE